MAWGYFMQGSEQQLEIDRIGSLMSEKLHCPVHYPAYGKKLFECDCNIVFPYFMVVTAYNKDDWSDVIALHNGEISR